MNNIFLRIYNENNQHSYSDFEEVLNAFNDWQEAKRKYNKAGRDISSIKSGSDFWWYDAERDVGREQAAKWRQDAFDSYNYWKHKNTEAKEHFDELLSKAPDLTAKIALEVMNSQELSDYLKYLEDKHIRIDSSNMVQKDGLPHVNENVTIEVETQKLASKIYDYGSTRGTYLTVTDKKGIQYSMFVKEDVANEIKDKDIYKISGMVKEIKDFYGKDQVVLKSPSIEFCPFRIDDKKEFNDLIDELSSEDKLTITKKADVPESAKPYVYYRMESTHGYIVDIDYQHVYRDKAADKYYCFPWKEWYSLD